MVVLVSLALASMGEGEAKACSCLRQDFGGGKLYVGSGGSIPADAEGFAWTGGEKLTSAKGRVTVVRVDGKKKVPVKYTIVEKGPIEVIVPAAKFKPGQVYEVTVREGPQAAETRKSLDPAAANVPPPEATTTVTIAAGPLALPQATVSVAAPAQEKIQIAHPASCSAEVEAATAGLKVELPAEAEPMREYLVYETRVDGAVWNASSGLCNQVDPGRTWTETAGTDKLFVACENPEALKPGRHKVEVEVASPDRAKVLTTPAVELELACAAPAPAPAEEPPAPAPTGAEPQEPPPVAKKGCSVGDPGFAWVLGVGLLFARRRRRAA
jgi:MYXO-CTERM domain-containing protein